MHRVLVERWRDDTVKRPGAAMSVVVTALWVASFILTYTFPLFNHALVAAKIFWIYAAICVAGFLFIRARLPETKGKTLQEIEDIWIQNES